MFAQKFHLAGNPEQEQRQLRRLQQQQQHGRSERQYEEDEDEDDEDNRKSSHDRRQQSSCSNLICALDPELLAQAFDVEMNIIEKLQQEQGNRGTIVRVKDRLQVVRPPRMEHEEHEEREQERERSQQRRRGRGGRHDDDNGLEETFCTMRLKENIADPERADIFNPQAGRLTTLNSYNLPILKFLRLSAERGVLYNVRILNSSSFFFFF